MDEVGVGLLLFIPSRELERRVLAALAGAGYDDLTPAQARLLMRVGADGTRITQLAEAALITKQTASHLVDQLERSGYVRRTPDPTDARARLVRLAERALAAKPLADGVVASVEQEWRAALGERRWAALRDALVRLRAVTDPYL